jgi:hypothetical protein
LGDVIDFYDRGGGEPTSGTRDALLAPLGLAAIDKTDLIAFLESLALDPLPAELLEQPPADE